MTARVSLGARIHLGFLNLSLGRNRLYGGIGFGLEQPRTVVRAKRADTVRCEHDRAGPYAERVVDRLGLPGAAVTVESTLPAHVGLGSGTRLALTVLAAIADAYDRPRDLREHAPALGRGGRSGVGVATAEDGGFVVDAGHPTTVFTSRQPERGTWTVPPVAVRRSVPRSWRVVIAVPATGTGRSGGDEDEAMREAVERADATVADRVARQLFDGALAGLATGDRALFGEGAAGIDRANGAWYADLQGGLYRPPAGQVVEMLENAPGVTGVGQSSWGPAVWAITDAATVEEVVTVAEDALAALGDGGTVHASRVATGGLREEPRKG
ncbi:MAG: beta-ribofuranosylaminobenzene 5'-phosphate synthase family protein [Halobacteriaceae archaeon]